MVPSVLYMVIRAAVAQVGISCFSTKARLIALLVHPLSMSAVVANILWFSSVSIWTFCFRLLSCVLTQQRYCFGCLSSCICSSALAWVLSLSCMMITSSSSLLLPFGIQPRSIACASELLHAPTTTLQYHSLENGF